MCFVLYLYLYFVLLSHYFGTLRTNRKFRSSNCDLCLISPFQWFITQLADRPLCFGASPLSIRPLTSTNWFGTSSNVVGDTIKDKSYNWNVYSNCLAVCWTNLGIFATRSLSAFQNCSHICIYAFTALKGQSILSFRNCSRKSPWSWLIFACLTWSILNS